MLLYTEFDGEYSYGIYFNTAPAEYLVHIRYNADGVVSGVWTGIPDLSSTFNYVDTDWYNCLATFSCTGDLGAIEECVSDLTSEYTNLGDPNKVFILSPALINPVGLSMTYVDDDSIFNFYKLTGSTYTCVGSYNRLTITSTGVIRKTTVALDLVIYSETTGGTGATRYADSLTYWRVAKTDIQVSTSAPFITLSSIDNVSNLDRFKEWFYLNFTYFGTLT